MLLSEIYVLLTNLELIDPSSYEMKVIGKLEFYGVFLFYYFILFLKLYLRIYVY